MDQEQLIHIFRHGHTDAEHSMKDPPLSKKGKLHAFNILYKYHTAIEAPTLVISSPHLRCLETALYAFHTEFNNKDWENWGGWEDWEDWNRSRLQQESRDCKKWNALSPVKFMVDPRLQEAENQGWGRGQPRNQLRSRREIPEDIRKHFIFPEEFYPPFNDNAEGENRVR